MGNYLRFKSIFGKPNSIDGVKKEADELRKEFFSYDKSLLVDSGVRLTFDEFSDAPDGRFSINYQNIDFDCFFKRNTDSDDLYVVFSGSRPKGSAEPSFKRWSYYKFINGSMLNIDDPMCKKFKKLNLGWYYGTENECYCDYICEIVKEFAARNMFKRIIFFASSGGGYAAIYCACKISRSYAMVINPQIKLSLYEPDAGKFRKICGLDLNKNDVFSRNDLSGLMRKADESRFLIVTNCASRDDMIQLNWLCRELNVDSGYGISRLRSNILSWVYEAEHASPHTAQEYPAMYFAMEYLLNNFDDAEILDDIYLIFNELWFSHYKLFNENKRLKIDMTKRFDLVWCQNTPNNIKKQMDVVTEKEVIISAENNSFNFKVIYDNFLPSCAYSLTIIEPCVFGGECNEITVLAKNTVTNTIYFSRDLAVTSDYTMDFKTGEDTTDVQLRIYAGAVGKTSGVSIRAKIALKKITTYEEDSL